MARSRDDGFRQDRDDDDYDDRRSRRRDDDDYDDRRRRRDDDDDYDDRPQRRRRDDDDDYDDVSRRVRRNNRRNDADDNMQPVDWVLAILCSGIGCILGIVYLAQGKKKGGIMLGVSLLFVVIWNIVRFAIMAANGGLR